MKSNKDFSTVYLILLLVLFVVFSIVLVEYVETKINREVCLFMIPHISGGLSTRWAGGNCYVLKFTDWVILDDYIAYLQKIYHDLYLLDCMDA